MNTRTPQLKRHRASGLYVIHWGGHDYYLGRDHAEAQERYRQQLEAWMEWRSAKARADAERPRRSSARRKTLFVLDLVEQFLEAKAARGRDGHYRNHLRRFTWAFAKLRADDIRAADVEALKSDMLAGGFHPKTVNHDVSAIKTLYRWAERMELVRPTNVRLAEGEPLPAVPDRALSLCQVWAMFEQAGDKLAPWLRTQYLTLCRPSEMVRVANRQGQWRFPWLFECTHKATWKTSELRRIVFSPQALQALEGVGPHWTRIDSYYRATQRAGIVGGPHPLRHSAATHLQMLGVPRGEIDQVLGHLPARVSRTYTPQDWRRLCGIAARLPV